MESTPREATAGPAREGRPMRMLGRDALVAILDAAVRRALADRLPSVPRASALDVQRMVREAFLAEIRGKGRTVRGVKKSQFLREVERARSRIWRERDQASSDLDELSQRLAMLEGLRGGEAQVGLPSHNDLRETMRGSFAALLEAEGLGGRSGAVGAQLADAAARRMRSEWERVLGAQTRAAGEEIEIFRRRIDKLNRHLEQTERALEEMARLKEGDPGLASIYKSVQGLDDDAIYANQKRAMLRAVFRDNVFMQKGELTPGGDPSRARA